jgi:hypothetical protein
MRRAFSWGLPLYAVLVTGIFVGKVIPDNSLRAEGDADRSDNIKAAPSSSPPMPAKGNAGSYPIPAPSIQPKHLFHLVIRYEGDGLPDQNMIATALAAAGEVDGVNSKKTGKSKAVKAKDMFQFIIRYEGEGIIDDNVAKVLKDYFAAALNEKPKDTPAAIQGTQQGPSLNVEPSEKAPPASAPAPRGETPAVRRTAPAPLAPQPSAPRSLPPSDE